MKSDLELRTYGPIALAGAASNNVKQRVKLQQYIESGDADDILEDIGDNRETFIEGISKLAQLLAKNRDLLTR